MNHLTPDEARLLGVLIEKAMTTPEGYPLTQNSAMNGANQKSNRDPVVSLDEHRVFEALEGLRSKNMVVRVTQAGSRVDKFRHNAGDVLHARPAELALLAELLLRGPQTLGELRGRASRMQPFESLEAVQNMLEAMMTREEPLVQELAPAPGSRAQLYVQLLAPDAHPIDVVPASSDTLASPGATLQAPTALSLGERVGQLEAETDLLRQTISRLCLTLGEPDPFAAAAPSAPSAPETVKSAP